MSCPLPPSVYITLTRLLCRLGEERQFALAMSSVAALPLALAGYAVNAASNVAWFFPMLVAAIAYFHYELLDPESRPIDVVTELLHPEYDFIVVGAGSAGTYRLVCSSNFILSRPG